MTSSYPELPQNTKHSLIHQPSVPLTDRASLINSSSNLSIQRSHNEQAIQPLTSTQLNNAAINLCLQTGCILLGFLGLFVQLFGLYVWTGLTSQGVIPNLGTIFNSFYFISLIFKLLECLLAVKFGFTPSSETAIKYSPILRIAFWLLVVTWGVFILVMIVLSFIGFLYSSGVWGTVVGVLLAQYITSTGAGLCTMLLMAVFNVSSFNEQKAVNEQLQNSGFKNVFIAPPNYIEMREKL